MRLKLTILLFFVVIGLYAQKQIQPYEFSVSDKNKTETILIYASATAVNNITFTLKNAADEILKNNSDEEIIFTVFPFTEVTFRKTLTDAIKSIKDDKSEKKFDIIKQRIQSSSESSISEEKKIEVEDVRNIYQFFNALVITAFEYDTEPVAGVLKYSLNTTITKKNIEGLDADLYFTKKAKQFRTYIWHKSLLDEGEEEVGEGKSDDEFMKFVKSFEKKEKLFDEFHKNTKGRHWHKARVKFKHYAEKKLKELYNVYEMQGYTENNFLSDYFEAKNIILLLESKNENKNKLIDKNFKRIEIIEKKIDSISKPYNNLVFERTIISNKHRNAIRIQEDLETQKTIKKGSNSDDSSSELKNEISSLENLIMVMKDSIRYYDNRLANLNNIIPANPLILKTEKESLKAEIDTLRIEIQSNEEEIKKTQKYIDNCISKNRAKINKLPLWNFEVESIEIDVNDGFIEHITAIGKVKLPVIDESLIRYFIEEKDEVGQDVEIKGMLEYFYKERIVNEILNNIIDKELKFENEYPIGFSSKSDFADLHNYTLYAFEGAEKIFSLPVTEIITAYIQRHQNDRLDFSPKDQVVRLPLDDFARSQAVELKKETSSKILNVNIYSDFLGLKEKNENGLLQFEVEKNIPLWTKRMVLGVGRSSNLGLVNYINFNLTWAKIGEEDQDLQVRYADRYVNNVYTPDRYVTFMDVIKFENTSVGADLNIASFDFPLLKARIELNAGIHYGRVKVVDTIITEGLTIDKLENRTNIIRTYPDFILRIRPEERFGAYLRFRPFKLIVPHNEEFYSVSSEKTLVTSQELTSNWLHRFELGTYYEPSSQGDNRFFFRYRYTTTSTWETNGYGEFQVGYLAYLKF